MKFCPRCGTSLVTRMDGGRLRPACPAAGCAYVHYGDYSIGTGAVVMRDDCVLLIERHTGARTWWQIPGGYVEVDEPIHAAIEREVLEETGVTARAAEVVGFRHSAGRPERPAANIYVVFRLEAVAGEPRPDGEESFQAGFFTSAEVAACEGLSAESRWAIDVAAANGRARGLVLADAQAGLQRPGYSLFGLPVV